MSCHYKGKKIVEEDILLFYLHFYEIFFSTAIIRIILRVSRINEHNPIGSMMTFMFSIFENSPVDSPVGKITYTDEDWPRSNIHYTIVGGNFGIPPKFYIESDTGNVGMLILVNNKRESLLLQGQAKLPVSFPNPKCSTLSTCTSRQH